MTTATLRRTGGNPFAQPNLRERCHTKAPPTSLRVPPTSCKAPPTSYKVPPTYRQFQPSRRSQSFPTPKLWWGLEPPRNAPEPAAVRYECTRMWAGKHPDFIINLNLTQTRSMIKSPNVSNSVLFPVYSLSVFMHKVINIISTCCLRPLSVWKKVFQIWVLAIWVQPCKNWS